MSEARLIREQHFQSDIFQPVAGGKLRKARVTQTYESSVFAGTVPEKGKSRISPVQGNYARRRYQESSSVMEGAQEQAANAAAEDYEKGNPRQMKTAGKKENPCRDFVYKPRMSLTCHSCLFREEAEDPVEITIRLKRVIEAQTLPKRISFPQETEPISHPASDLTAPLALSLSCIPDKLTSGDIKRYCGNVQLVAAKIPIDPLTGYCQGSGTIQVRGNSVELKRMELALISSGMTVQPVRSRPSR